MTTNPQFKFPQSSNINTLKYTGDLYVTFKSVPVGQTTYYRYKNVPVETFEKLILISLDGSVGSAFFSLVRKGGFEFTKVVRHRDPKTGRFCKPPLS